MTRFLLIAVSMFLIGVSLLGVLAPHSVLSSFLTVNEEFTKMRVFDGTILFSYGVFRFLRQPLIRLLLLVGGAGAILTGMLGFISIYILPMDQFVFIISGIYAVLGYMELKPAEITYIPTFWNVIPRLLVMRMHRGAEVLTQGKQPTAQA